MRLIIPILLNCTLVLVVYALDKFTKAKDMSYWTKQILIGISFGVVSAFASDFGVEFMGTVVNVRDAAPLSAGLIFGAPAGIISGIIGGMYRWMSVLWGGGTFTRVACTAATILAGFMAAALRIYMFDDKKPTWGYGICIGIVCEVIHMLLIFLTNMNNASYTFTFVRGATLPMIIGNTFALTASIMIISILTDEGLRLKKRTEQIAQTFQRWLLLCIVVAFIATVTFVYSLQNGMARIETNEMFTSAINDVQNDVRGKSDEYMLSVISQIVKEYKVNPEVSVDELAKKYNVIEINIVNEEGLIIDSTDKTLINAFNMNSTEQSKEFSVLSNGRISYIQEYGPVGSDGVTMRKFAGMSLGDGSYIQIGYSSEQFHEFIDEFVVDVTKNRHVGTSGFIRVLDEDLNIISDDQYNGHSIEEIGIQITDGMRKGQTATQLYTTTIFNEYDPVETYIYTYLFVEGYCIVAALPEVEAMFMRDASIYTTIFTQVIIFATLFVFIYVLIKKVIINNLKKINKTLSQITNGNLDVTVDVRSNTEFASLSDDINTTVATLKRYIAEASARIDKELEYAKQIQLSVLPTNYPYSEDCSIYAQMMAAKEVGGDFYDFYQLNDTTMAILVADVSGKGIPAAMFMMTAKTIIKELAERGLPVDEILTKANNKLCEANDSGMFVTCWMAIIDLETGKLQYANAGHNPPLLMKEGGEFEYMRSRAGFVLGGMDSVRYRMVELNMEPGDRLFLYTDGVTEATNSSQELYGEERLLTFINQHKDIFAFDLLPAIKYNIDEFVKEAPQFDDITMLMFDYKPRKGIVSMKNKTFPAKAELLRDVLAFFEETLESYNCPMKTMIAISVAIEEVFVNVANYAYGKGEGDVKFNIHYDEATRTATFIMKDHGMPFDPLKKPDPDITLSADERDIGGLGIYITKKTMDSVSYAYENGENVLTMIKKI